MRSMVTFVATGAYTGYFPATPGTAGSALGLLIGAWWCVPLWQRSPAAFLMLFSVLFVGACFVAGEAEKQAGAHDASQIVIDEIFGMVAAMFLLPAGWRWLLAAFVLFRALDVVKPWPASYFDRMSGGAGVMLDDLAAAIYANLALQLVHRIV
jgi:phosphatidylglycerophosphatase A